MRISVKDKIRIEEALGKITEEIKSCISRQKCNL